MNEYSKKTAHIIPPDGERPDPAADNQKQCPICLNFVSEYGSFGSQARQNAKCPHCNSLERHRALWLYLVNHTRIISGQSEPLSIKLLHFAPEKVLYGKFAALSGIDYYPVDIDPDRYKDIRDVIDIQDIEYEDCMFDIIICSHVFEHVPDDHTAMRELRRVLKKDGTAFILSPVSYTLELTLEESGYNTPELRKQYYGQHDHLRRYGRDFPARLSKAGFCVKEINMSREVDGQTYDTARYGLKEGSKIYICTHYDKKAR